MPRNYYSRRRRPVDPYVVVLLMELFQRVNNLPYKPPVTLFFMGLQSIIHFLPFSKLSIEEVCLDPIAITYQYQFSRLWLSALFHLDEYHLYYNLSSFLMKGLLLEQRYGSDKFLVMILFFIFTSNIIYVLLSFSVLHFLNDESLVYTRTAGFSAVLFALKVVMHFYDEGEANLFGFELPSKYLYWAELILIRLLIPQSSFFGHLSGILAGLIYVKFEANMGFRGVQRIARRVYRGLSGQQRYRYAHGRTRRRERSPNRRRGHLQEGELDISAVDIDEQRALLESIEENKVRNNHPNVVSDAEHLRQRRLAAIERRRII